jgi:DNA-directed RNA polymerase specialized sigma24 family protein
VSATEFESTRYIDAKDVSKTIRGRLKAAFPGVNLDSLKRAARAKARADARYKAALVAAHAAGASYAEIAHAVGVSRQAVRQLIERDIDRLLDPDDDVRAVLAHAPRGLCSGSCIRL